MNMEKGATDTSLIVSEIAVPPPESISAEARRFLSMAAAGPLPPPYPELHDTQAWLDRVAQVDALVASMNLSAEYEHRFESEAIVLEGVPTYRIMLREQDERTKQNILFEIHGGGLFTCGGDLTRVMGIKMAAEFDAIVYAPDYRMPPLHPYPAPLDDCVAAYRALLELHAPERVVVQGSSAGGNLAAALMLRVRDAGLPFPAGLVLNSPEADLTESGDSFRTLAGIDTALRRSLMPASLLYANGHDLADPLLSPLFANFSKGFPPTMLTTGTRDLFLSNAVRMHRALRSAGIASTLVIAEAMPHAGFGGSPEDKQYYADMKKAALGFWQAGEDTD